jgi:hypothetical protein
VAVSARLIAAVNGGTGQDLVAALRTEADIHRSHINRLPDLRAANHLAANIRSHVGHLT